MPSAGALFQVPFTVALFVLPLLFVFRSPRRVLARHRLAVLAVQGLLTWVPFAVFGGRWQVGIGGLLAGLVLLSIAGWVSWLAVGALLAADVLVRATVTGLPWEPAWSGALWAALSFVDDTAMVFGMIWLAQLVGDLQNARDQAAELAVASERLHAAKTLQSVVGECLADIAVEAAGALHSLTRDPGEARTQISAVGAAARVAVAHARAAAASSRGFRRPEAAPAAGGGVVIGARVAWAVLVVVLCGYAAAGLNDAFTEHDDARLTAFIAAATVLGMALQLHHSPAARQGGKPRAWPLTLALQAALVYVFFLPPLAAYTVLAGFVAGAVLLLIPGWWQWAGYAAVVVSWSALYAAVPLHGVAGSDRGALMALYPAGTFAQVGLLVYGLSRLAGMAREMEAVRSELARLAAVGERIRVARDVHDLLGLGLSAIALKADLVVKLIGRDDARAAAEIQELSRTCAAARADVRLVTGGGQKLSLAAELTATRQILASAGVQVHASIPAGPLPAAADEVLAVVLREAVTNMLRHSAATSATIEASTVGGAVRLAVGNDGVASQPGPPGDGPGAGGGTGLANLAARVHAAGGRLATRRNSSWFELVAEILLPSALGADAVTEPAQASRPRPAFGWLAGGR